MSRLTVTAQAREAIENFDTPDELAFGRTLVPIMVEMDYKGGSWSAPQVVPYRLLEIDPCAKVLHYGQEIFEGLKAYRTEDGRVNLFRPDKNANRFNYSARRMAMPELPVEDFISSVEAISSLCKKHIPSELGTSLYIRPFMFATQVALGIGPSDEYKFLVVASPSGSYFKGGSVKVLIEREACRAAPGGTGTAKCGGNYASGLMSALEMQKLGYHQSLWLDAENRSYIEELSGMNFFAVIDGELFTPRLNDTILKGVTRDSIIKLASDHFNIKTHCVPMKIHELIEKIKSGACTEAFACGTAAIITPIELLGEKNGATYQFKEPSGPISMKLRDHLLKIQAGLEKGPQGWVREVGDY